MAKVDWIEIDKGVYTLKEKSSRPMIKLDLDSPKEIDNLRFNPSKRVNLNESFYCRRQNKRVRMNIDCIRCSTYLCETCRSILMEEEREAKKYKQELIWNI
jgi:hypothetical protein